MDVSIELDNLFSSPHNRPMKTQDAINHFGGIKPLCKALGLKARQTIYTWGRYPPWSRQYQLEIITEGKLRAEKQARMMG